MSYNYLLDLDELRHYRARVSMNQYSSHCLSPEDQMVSIQGQSPKPSYQFQRRLQTPFSVVSKQASSGVNQPVETKPSFQNSTKITKKFDLSNEKNLEENSFWKESRNSDIVFDLKRAPSIKMGGPSPNRCAASKEDECRVGEEDSAPSENMRILSIPSSKRLLTSKLKPGSAKSGGCMTTRICRKD